ncbi:MAG: alpha/beta hydrolase [Polaribacter sp.]|nr:alpha/beta hydrolase [Polaribacter sp.]
MKIKNLILITTILALQNSLAQKSVEDFGYRHFSISFQNDSVDFIVKSKVGDELKKKPLFIFIQGSQAKPLIKYDKNGAHYSPFSFSEKIFRDKFHLVCINKPNIPLIIEKSQLGKNGEFTDNISNEPPKEYTKKANLIYYTERNNKVIQYLEKQSWVDTNMMVVAGHSEGSSIAVKMAVSNKRITHLIYSGGTPYYSRILSMITQDRKLENEKESWVESDFEYWEKVNQNPFEDTRQNGWNAYKGTFTFSELLNDDFKRLTIPVLISYGTKDEACPFNDLLRIEMIQENKKNIHFKAYFNREHNYFELQQNGKVNYEKFGWDIVGTDWLMWLALNKT